MKINFVYQHNKQESKNIIENIKLTIKDNLDIKNIKYVENDFSSKKADIYIVFLDDEKVINQIKQMDINKNISIIITFSIKVEFIKEILQYTNKLFYIKASKNQILYEILNKCNEINKKKEIKKNVKTNKKV